MEAKYFVPKEGETCSQCHRQAVQGIETYDGAEARWCEGHREIQEIRAPGDHIYGWRHIVENWIEELEDWDEESFFSDALFLRDEVDRELLEQGVSKKQQHIGSLQALRAALQFGEDAVDRLVQEKEAAL